MNASVPTQDKLIKRLANLGYGSRKQVAVLFSEGRVTDAGGAVLRAEDRNAHADVRIDDEALDPPRGLVVMLHKPVGYVCSTRDRERTVYELLPPRLCRRSPLLSTVGRLDKDTSGLLLLTDDGTLLHRIISPKTKLAKVYEVTLVQDLRGTEAAIFASGTLRLESEQTPLAPATLQTIDPRHARLTLTQGRYHQVRRMFAAVGNHVEALHRSRIGGLGLDHLAAGQWRTLDEAGLETLFSAN